MPILLFEGDMTEHSEQSEQEYMCPKCNEAHPKMNFFDVGHVYRETKCDGCGYIYTDAEEHCSNRAIYEKECKCGEKLFLLAQEDNEPEWIATVGMRCFICGRLNWFTLPVN